MILFKACPRCGGDVDTTYPDDALCVQCGHRPDVVYPGPRINEAGLKDKAPAGQAVGHRETLTHTPAGAAEQLPERTDLPAASQCPRCGVLETVVLEKLRAEDNTCHRCRRCGHIFSPASRQEEGRRAPA